MAKRDDELMMMGKLWRLLEPLFADARGRILNYLDSRHEEAMTAERLADQPVNFPIER